MSTAVTDSSGGVLVDAGSAVATVTIDRPQARNALDAPTLRELLAAFEGLAASPLLRCVILTGAGDKAFVSGADINQFRAFSTPQDASDYETRIDEVLGTIAGDDTIFLATRGNMAAAKLARRLKNLVEHN